MMWKDIKTTNSNDLMIIIFNLIIIFNSSRLYINTNRVNNLEVDCIFNKDCNIAICTCSPDD